MENDELSENLGLVEKLMRMGLSLGGNRRGKGSGREIKGRREGEVST